MGHRLVIGHLEAMRRGVTDLGRPPDVEGRVVWPAHLGKGLATVVVRPTAARETLGIPPVPDTAAVGMPPANRSHALEERGMPRLGVPTFTAKGSMLSSERHDECEACNQARFGATFERRLSELHLGGSSGSRDRCGGPSRLPRGKGVG